MASKATSRPISCAKPGINGGRQQGGPIAIRPTPPRASSPERPPLASPPSPPLSPFRGATTPRRSVPAGVQWICMRPGPRAVPRAFLRHLVGLLYCPCVGLWGLRVRESCQPMVSLSARRLSGPGALGSERLRQALCLFGER